LGAVSATPKDLVRIRVRASSARRDGGWVVPKELDVKVNGGSVTLDFTEAVRASWWTPVTYRWTAEASNCPSRLARFLTIRNTRAVCGSIAPTQARF
jgi:hypothetical protein